MPLLRGSARNSGRMPLLRGSVRNSGKMPLLRGFVAFVAFRRITWVNRSVARPGCNPESFRGTFRSDV